ncbi:MAG: GTP cyclohydrolase, FolE2/MptA family, partial [Planctomycetota bacterium]
MTARETIPDVQASSDDRRVAIDRVGVKEVTYPMRLRTRAGGEQSTVATINMYVALPHTQKGTHMSRFLEVGLLRLEALLDRPGDLGDALGCQRLA